jgi:hypothetical protein
MFWKMHEIVATMVLGQIPVPTVGLASLGLFAQPVRV